MGIGKLPVKLDLTYQIPCWLDRYHSSFKQTRTRSIDYHLWPLLYVRLVITWFKIKDFSGTILNAIHDVHPFYLIACFERFGDTFDCHYLFGKPCEHLVGSTVNLTQMHIQLTAHEQMLTKECLS